MIDKTSLTTQGSSGEVLLHAPNNRQYEIILLTAYKDSFYNINISIETGDGYRTVFAYSMDNGLVNYTDPITLNAGDKLISQSSSIGIDINITYKINAYTR